MAKWVGALLLFAACSSRSPAPLNESVAPAANESVAPAAVPAEPAPVAEVAAPAVVLDPSCGIAETAPTPVALPKQLEAVAPQYFHSSVRDGFNDLPDGARVYTWFDAFDLARAVTPPKGMAIIERSTRTWLFGRSADGSPRYARRGESSSKPLPHANMRLIDAIDTATGETWVIGQRVGLLSVLRIDARGAVHAMPIEGGVIVGRDDARVVDAGAGKVAVVWVSSLEGLSVQVAWPALGPTSTLVDLFPREPDVHDLSTRTGFDLAVAAHANGMIAIAWRPLSDPPSGTTVDMGSASEPPLRPAAADVRVLLVGTQGRPGAVERHPTTAVPLGGVTGHGPWPLHGNGMVAGSTKQGAVVLWLEADGSLVGVRPGMDAPVKVRGAIGWPRLELLRTSDALELLTFDSSRGVHRSTIVCAQE